MQMRTSSLLVMTSLVMASLVSLEGCGGGSKASAPANPQAAPASKTGRLEVQVGKGAKSVVSGPAFAQADPQAGTLMLYLFGAGQTAPKCEELAAITQAEPTGQVAVLGAGGYAGKAGKVELTMLLFADPATKTMSMGGAEGAVVITHVDEHSLTADVSTPASASDQLAGTIEATMCPPATANASVGIGDGAMFEAAERPALPTDDAEGKALPKLEGHIVVLFVPAREGSDTTRIVKELNDVAKRHRKDGVVTIGVATGDPSTVKALQTSSGATFPFAVGDPKGRASVSTVFVFDGSEQASAQDAFGPTGSSVSGNMIEANVIEGFVQSALAARKTQPPKATKAPKAPSKTPSTKSGTQL